MPSLADALSSLSQHSSQIHHFSSQNQRPAGPFTQSFLYAETVPHLIRDAHESESRLFKFIGEVDNAAGGAAKRVEKREGVVTPLRELRRRKDGNGIGEDGQGGRDGKDEVEVMLRTAIKLVDDYRPMPRARAHIAQLIEAHHRQLERIDELERLIAEATNPSDTVRADVGSSADSGTASSSQSRAKLSPDEAIRAEEASLRALEASVSKLRRAKDSGSGLNDVDNDTTTSPGGSAPLRSPSVPTQETVGGMGGYPAQTPGKTPTRVQMVTNSLVNGTGATPHRPRPTIDRFSPLRSLTTPRAPVGAPSGLRSVSRPEGRVGLFAGRSLSRSTTTPRGAPATPAQDVLLAQDPNTNQNQDQDQQMPEKHEEQEEHEQEDQDQDQEDEDEAEQFGEDETARLAAPIPVEATNIALAPQRLEETDEDFAPTTGAGTDSSAPQELVPTTVEGVQIGLEDVHAAVNKIWSTLGEMMRQGVPEGHVVEPTVESTVRHLHRISQSDLPPPPSPSSASTLSSLPSAPSAKAPPINKETILVAHLCLLLLRTASASASPSAPSATSVDADPVMGVGMNDVKEQLGSTAKARGWDGAAELGTKIIYAAVGKRVVTIDRRGGAGGKVRFAE